MIKQVHLYIRGDVIGVGFRAWTKIQAKLHSVLGWVRNVYDRPDVFGERGGIEVVIQGDGEIVQVVVEKVKQGPPISFVEYVDVHYEQPTDVFEDFEIRL